MRDLPVKEGEMTNYSTTVAFTFPGTEEQGAWLKQFIERLECGCNYHPGVEVKFDGKDIEITGEEVIIDDLASVLWKFMRHFKRSDYIEFTWASTAGRMEADCFHGGACLVTAGNWDARNTSDMLAELRQVAGIQPLIKRLIGKNYIKIDDMDIGCDGPFRDDEEADAALRQYAGDQPFDFNDTVIKVDVYDDGRIEAWSETATEFHTVEDDEEDWVDENGCGGQDD